MILFLPFEVKALKAVFYDYSTSPRTPSQLLALTTRLLGLYFFDDINDKTANCSGLDISVS